MKTDVMKRSAWVVRDLLDQCNSRSHFEHCHPRFVSCGSFRLVKNNYESLVEAKKKACHLTWQKTFSVTLGLILAAAEGKSRGSVRDHSVFDQCETFHSETPMLHPHYYYLTNTKYSACRWGWPVRGVERQPQRDRAARHKGSFALL